MWRAKGGMMSAKGGIDSLEKVLSVAKDAGLDVEKLKADIEASRADHDKVIAENRNLAQMLGINGTPAFVIDSEIIPGAAPHDQLAETLKSVRDNGGCKFC
jgi:predicted DsbA family dithiol-disulfide isomerase